MKTATAAAALAMAALVAGCASLRTVSCEVATFGDWPAARAPGSYAFERLPSQQARPAESDLLEASARPALEKAGFKPVGAGQEPDVLVQVAARDKVYAVQPWNDPLWWRGGFGGWHYGPWGTPPWDMGLRYEVPRYERQVALLLRDRASGKPLFEAHASSESNRDDRQLLAALFSAALVDFPHLGVNPRQVDVLPPG